MPHVRVALAALALLLAPLPAAALFHISVIDEVMTSYGGDADVQFVEINMRFFAQTQVGDSVLGVFDATGAFVDEALVVPGDVANSGDGVRWIMGTTAFETASGLQVDFEFPPGLVPQSGMICWGAPGDVPPAPDSWDHTNPENYVDCVAYGAYTGATNSFIGTPTPLSPDGHSLQRVSETHDSQADFACGDPATPTNNAGGTGSVTLAATTPCPAPPTPLTKQELKCVTGINGAGGKVAKALTTLARSCAGGFQKGKLASAVDCLAADGQGKVGKAEAKTLATETKQCAPPPPLAYTGGSAVNAAARNRASLAVEALFTRNLVAATLDTQLVPKATDADAAKCQEVALLGLAKVVDGFLKAGVRLKKEALSEDPRAESNDELAAALDAAFPLDGKLATLEQRVTGSVAKRCQFSATAPLFAAPCSAAADPLALGECVVKLGECYACLALSDMDALDLDCSVFVSDEAGSLCGEA